MDENKKTETEVKEEKRRYHVVITDQKTGEVISDNVDLSTVIIIANDDKIGEEHLHGYTICEASYQLNDLHAAIGIIRALKKCTNDIVTHSPATMLLDLLGEFDNFEENDNENSNEPKE